MKMQFSNRLEQVAPEQVDSALQVSGHLQQASSYSVQKSVVMPASPCPLSKSKRVHSHQE